MVATNTVNNKNLFTYAENNPVNGKDAGGGAVETVFDIVSLAGSVVDVCCNPMDPWAWAGMAGDAIDLIPFATGVGESIKGIRALAKAADTADDGRDAAKAVSGVHQTMAVVGDTVPIGGCFVAGTLIITGEGKKKIEDIRVGDLVYAKEAVSGETGYKQVTELFRVEKTKLIHLTIGEEEIITTEEHPFWVDGYGFVEAGKLTEGLLVEKAGGDLLPVSKVEVEYLTEPVTVYNFEVEEWHTYYVSGEEIFVHNMCAYQSGSDTTNLYRVMSEAEYDSVMTHGKFVSYERAMEEKWFATTQEDATKWADIFIQMETIECLRLK